MTVISSMADSYHCFWELVLSFYLSFCCYIIKRTQASKTLKMSRKAAKAQSFRKENYFIFSDSRNRSLPCLKTLIGLSSRWLLQRIDGVLYFQQMKPKLFQLKLAGRIARGYKVLDDKSIFSLLPLRER